MTAAQFMDLTFFHELSHSPKVGKLNPHIQKNMQKLWKDCIQ